MRLLPLLTHALLLDLLSFLRKESQFLELSLEERKLILKNSSVFPKSMQVYLALLTEEELFRDLAVLLPLLRGERASLDHTQSRLLVAFAVFLSKEVADILDGGTLSLTGNFGKECEALCAQYSYQEVALELYDFMNSIKATPYIVVQAPFSLPQETRQEIRTHFATQFGFAFPVFAVQKTLIGGFRVLIDGEVQDLSWLSRIQNLSSLLTLRA